MQGYTYQQREEALRKVLSPEERPDFVPILAVSDAAVFGYSGKSVMDAFREDDDETIARRMTAYYDDVYFDLTMGDTIVMTPQILEALDHLPQMRYATDGSTLETIQLSPMREDEYPKLIADCDGFIRDTLLPRRFPMLFEEDIKKTTERLKTVIASNNRLYGSIYPIYNEILMEKGIPGLNCIDVMTTPLDMLFDSFRGFTGLLVDIRRRHDQVKEACEMLWHTQLDRFGEGYEIENSMLLYAAHVAPYINDKTYRELYWPYVRKMVEDMAARGNVLYFICQGSFLRRAELFNELPKNSVVIHCDDDDVVEMSRICGNRQIISGGTAQALLSHAPLDKCIDEAKRIIDGCAHTGSFIYSIDKTLSCIGDINENLIKVNQFVHEYGKQ